MPRCFTQLLRSIKKNQLNESLRRDFLKNLRLDFYRDREQAYRQITISEFILERFLAKTTLSDFCDEKDLCRYKKNRVEKFTSTW